MDTRLTQEQLDAAKTELTGWELSPEKLRRTFRFESFPEAIAFMVKASFKAEALNHHPNWSNVYSTVEVEIWSHDHGGVTGRCLELARAMG